MPSVLPLRSVGFLMPVSARQVSSRPLFLKVCEMLTSGTPFSRDASADGIQSTVTSAPPPASTCGGATSGPPGWMVTDSAACAFENVRPSERPAASANACFMQDSKFKADLADLGPVGRMPKRCRAFGQRDKAVESHSGEGGQRNLRPDHVDGHAARLGGDAKSDTLRR